MFGAWRVRRAQGGENGNISVWQLDAPPRARGVEVRAASFVCRAPGAGEGAADGDGAAGGGTGGGAAAAAAAPGRELWDGTTTEVEEPAQIFGRQRLGRAEPIDGEGAAGHGARAASATDAAAHTGPVRAVAWAPPPSALLASAAHDRALMLWDTASSWVPVARRAAARTDPPSPPASFQVALDSISPSPSSRRYGAHSGWMTDVLWSPVGEALLAASDTPQVRLQSAP